MRFLGLVPLLPLVLALSACGERPALRIGEKCSFNSDCESPLVCRLDRCRRECAGTRDCPLDSMCIVDELGIGVCQVEDACELNSECLPPLVCRFGECTNECRTEEDCAAGASCLAQDDGALGCVDVSEKPCQVASDCDEEWQFCAPDGRCREQCREDRDCRDGAVCVGTEGMRMCVRDLPDDGVDAGAADSGS